MTRLTNAFLALFVLLAPLATSGAPALAGELCQATLQSTKRDLTPNEARHLALRTQLDRLKYLRASPPKDQIQSAEKELGALENTIRAEDPHGARDAEDVIAKNRLQSLDELYARFADEKAKYDAFDSSWKWRQHQGARNAQFGRRFEKISLAYMKAHGISTQPHYEGRLRDGVTLVPDSKGSYLNRLASKLKRRWDINLVVSPKNLVQEGTDGMYASAVRDIYVSKDLLLNLRLETTTRHEITHAYIDSFAGRGIGTPFDAELNALEGKKISSYGTSGYDEYEDASEVATYAQEVADGGNALQALLNAAKGGDGPDTDDADAGIREEIATKIQVPAVEGWKLTQAMIDGTNDALKTLESDQPITIAMGKRSDVRNPAFAYVDIPVGDRAILTLKLVNDADIALVRNGGVDLRTALEPVIEARLREIVELDTQMLGLYAEARQQISSVLGSPSSMMAPEALQKLADLSFLPKRLAFSKLSRR